MQKLNFFKSFDVDDLVKNSRKVSFLNNYSIAEVSKLATDLKDIVFFCDGFVLAGLVSLFHRKSVGRYSFDFGSVAVDVFKYADENQKTLFVVGSKQEYLNSFLGKVQALYSDINIVGSSHGYFDDSAKTKLIERIKLLEPDIVIVGLGAVRQEMFLTDLVAEGYGGAAFSCGGFIHQTALTKGAYYYPTLVNKLGLRAFYRMWKEPNTIKRYLFVYPFSIYVFLKMYLKKQFFVM